MRAEVFFEALRSALEARPPGRPEVVAGKLRPAAVLAPFFEEGGEAGVLLVERSSGLGHHAGQIAFPGGGRDEEEDDLACALRESSEEIGLPPDEVEVLGSLDPRPVVTGYRVVPFAGRLRRWPRTIVPDPGEVASVLQVPVGRLVEPGVLHVARLGDAGQEVNFFDVGDHVIWGATARILRELLEAALRRPLEAGGDVPWERVRW